MWILLSLVFLLVLLSVSVKERFTSERFTSERFTSERFTSQCSGTDCKSCANQSGCSWCASTNACIPTQSIKSTDPDCNLLNVVSSSFSCSVKDTSQLNDPKDEQLYKDQIADRVRPPNVYMNKNMEYTPETVMANLNDVRQTVNHYNMQLPDIIATSIIDNIQPMVRGILSH
jgi:hypothetical protein